MHPFPSAMRSMTKRDRTTLGGLVLAMIVGVGGSLALAASCLGRDRAHRVDDPISAFPEDRSARTSSGGVPGEEAVGETQITSVELPAGAPNTAPPAPENAPPPNPNPTPAAGMAPHPPAAAPHAPQAHATVNVHVAGDQVHTTTSSTADGGAATPIAAPADDARDGGAGTTGTGDAGATAAPPPATAAPPARWMTEPPTYGASSWTPNHEAGAGPFTTERNIPDRPGP
jgi:hypothetical protein